MSGAWCPTCRDWSVGDVGERCGWCDTTIVRRRGGWKRPDMTGRIGEAAARAIHAKYQTGVSANQLGKQLFAVLGYKTPNSCAIAIGDAFRRHRLPIRGHAEATRLASTRNGLSPRDDAERRRRRIAAGLVGSGERAMQPRQPRCAGVKQQYPRKGERCANPAAVGSDYCPNHDPRHRARTLHIIERARARLGRNAA